LDAVQSVDQKIGYYLVNNESDLNGDSYQSGDVDLHDLIDSRPALLTKGLILHFTVERMETPDYEKAIRDNSEEGQLKRDKLFSIVHPKGIQKELEFYQEEFPKTKIEMPKLDLVVDYDSKEFFDDHMLINMNRIFGELEIIYTIKLKKLGKNTYESLNNGNGELVKTDFKITEKNKK